MAKKKRRFLKFLFIYLVIGVVFGTMSFIERAEYASFNERIIDFVIGVIFWPLLLIIRLQCHNWNFSKILEGCRLIPSGLT